MDNSPPVKSEIHAGFRLAPGAVLPTYGSKGASCFDISACIPDDLGTIEIKSGERVIVSTGLYPVIPAGYELQVRPRSGFASKELVLIPNSPATIDEDYRGELFVTLFNASKKDICIEHQQRIAQARLCEAPQHPIARYSDSDYADLPKTERGTGGLGSTGYK